MIADFLCEVSLLSGADFVHYNRGYAFVELQFSIFMPKFAIEIE